MRRLFPLFSFALILLSLARAQPGTPEPITVRVQAFSAEEEEVEGLFWMEGREGRPLRVPSTFLPESITYTGPNPMVFYRETPAGGEGLPPFQPVAQVQIPGERSLVSTTWFYHPGRRRFVFLLPEEDRLQVRGVTWFPENRE